MHDRRAFLAATAALLIAPPARAQQQRLKRVALMATGSPSHELTENGAANFAALLGELRRRGYVEGATVAYERWGAAGLADTEFGKLAERVVETRPDLIFADGTRLVLAVKNATASIPVVFTAVGPIEAGIVPNLPRPGANLTGFSTDAGLEMRGKQLQLLAQAKPGVTRVIYPATPQTWANAGSGELRKAASSLGITLVPALIDGPVTETSIRLVLATHAGQKDLALFQTNGPDFIAQSRTFAELALSSGWPTIGGQREQAAAGYLLSYGANIPDMFRGAADYIDRILKGAKPADLPVQQPMRFDFVVNLKTAKALGIELPLMYLSLATEYIE